jgi:hypothetical protein
VFVLVAFKYNSSNSEINTLYCFYSAIKRAFGKVIYSEFRGVISRNKTKASHVKITEGESGCILNIELHKNNLTEFNLQMTVIFLYKSLSFELKNKSSS